MSWKGKDPYVICQDCGAVCIRSGWFKRALNVLLSRRYICCLCCGKDSLCASCRKYQKRAEHSKRK